MSLSGPSRTIRVEPLEAPVAEPAPAPAALPDREPQPASAPAPPERELVPAP